MGQTLLEFKDCSVMVFEVVLLTRFWETVYTYKIIATIIFSFKVWKDTNNGNKMQKNAINITK